MKCWVRIRITTRVLRTLDKVGGLDNYILGEKSGRIKELGMGGWKLRWRIMQTEAVQERFRQEREALGLEPEEEILVGSNGNLASKVQVQAEMDQFDNELAKGEDIEIGDMAEMVEKESFMKEEPAKQEKLSL